MANIQQDSYLETNRFGKVIFQRSADVMEYELNELQDNLRVDKYISSAAVGGDGSPDTGLQVIASGASNSVTIKAGTYQLAGYHLLFPTDQTFSTLTTNPGPGARIDTIYAALSETEVTDPNQIPEVGETTRRRKLVVQFGVAEGVAIPSNTSTPIWQGGTNYVSLAAITRPANQAPVNQSQVIDLRGVLPRATLDKLTERSTASGRQKLIVQSDTSEGALDTQLGVRQPGGGALAFSVDRSGNVTTLGAIAAQSYRTILPTASDTYDLGSTSQRWRNAYFSGSVYIGDSAVDLTSIQGNVNFNNSSGNPGLSFDGTSGHIGIGGAFDASRYLKVYGDQTVTGNLTVGGVDASVPPATDNTYALGASAKRWSNIYSANATLNAAAIGVASVTTLQALTPATSISVANSLVPAASNTYTLGASGTTWLNIYTQAIAVTGAVTAASLSSSASNLTLNTGAVPGSNNAFTWGNSASYFSGVYGNIVAANTLQTTAGTGNISLANILAPSADNTLDLGTSALRYRNIYAATATINALNVGGTFAATADNTYDLGTTSNRWRDIYLGQRVLAGYTSSPTSSVSAINGSLLISENAFMSGGGSPLVEVYGGTQPATNSTVTPLQNWGMSTANGPIISQMMLVKTQAATGLPYSDAVWSRIENGVYKGYIALGGGVSVMFGYGNPASPSVNPVGLSTGGAWYPVSGNTNDMGLSTNQWRTIYAQNLTLSAVATITGLATFNASAAVSGAGVGNSINCAGDLVAAGGFRNTVGPASYFYSNSSSSTNGVPMQMTYWDQSASVMRSDSWRWAAPFAGSIVGISAACGSSNGSAGLNSTNGVTITIQATKNGVAAPITNCKLTYSSTVNAGVTQGSGQVTFAKDTYTFAAGDVLGLLFSTAAASTYIGAVAYLTVEY